MINALTNTLLDRLHLNSQGVISLIGAGGKTSLMYKIANELAASGKNVLTTTTTKIFMPTQVQSPFTIIEDTYDELVKKIKSRINRYHHFTAGSMYDVNSGKLKGFPEDLINKLWQARLFDWIIVEADGAKRKPLKATDLHEPVIPKDTSHLILVTGLDAVGTFLDDKHVHRPELFSKNTGLASGQTIDEQSIALSIAFEMKKAQTLSHPLYNIVFLNKADTNDRIKSGRKIADCLQTKTTIDQIVTASLLDEIPVKECFDIQKTKQR